MATDGVKTGSSRRRVAWLLVGLAVALLGWRCTRCDGKGGGAMVDRDLEGRTFSVMFSSVGNQLQELTGRPDLVGVGAVLKFEDPLVFTRIDETIDATGYLAVTTSETGEAYTGKFTFRATLRKGYTGGPPGSATELFVQVDEESTRLLEKLSPPKAGPGVKAILPGQVVVRRIKEGELAGLDDRYLIELPGGKSVRLLFDPWPEEYAVRLSVTRNGVQVPTRIEKGFIHLFESGEGGLHELRIRSGAASAKEPDSYRFEMYWGKSVSSGGDLRSHTVGWRTRPATGGAGPSGKNP